MRTVLGLLFLLFTGAFATVVVMRRPLADVEVRSVAPAVHSGRLVRPVPITQRFRCRNDGLRRIRVLSRAVGAPPPPGQDAQWAQVELELRAEDRLDEVIVRVGVDATELLRGGTRFLDFEFSPVEDSAGRTFRFTLSPSGEQFVTNAAVWLQYRGAAHAVRAWGDRTVAGPTLTDRFQARDPDLSGVAVGFEQLDLRDDRAAPARLRLREVGDAEWRREATAELAGVSSGFATFTFEPLPGSRFRELELELDVPPDARAVASEEGLALIGLYGGGAPRTGALGASLGLDPSAPAVDGAPRWDLVFGAFGRQGPGSWLRGREVGWAPVLGALLALAAAGLLWAFGQRSERAPGGAAGSAAAAEDASAAGSAAAAEDASAAAGSPGVRRSAGDERSPGEGRPGPDAS